MTSRNDMSSKFTTTPNRMFSPFSGQTEFLSIEDPRIPFISTTQKNTAPEVFSFQKVIEDEWNILGEEIAEGSIGSPFLSLFNKVFVEVMMIPFSPLLLTASTVSRNAFRLEEEEQSFFSCC